MPTAQQRDKRTVWTVAAAMLVGAAVLAAVIEITDTGSTSSAPSTTMSDGALHADMVQRVGERAGREAGQLAQFGEPVTREDCAGRFAGARGNDGRWMLDGDEALYVASCLEGAKRPLDEH